MKLYHGTSLRALQGILRDGIKPRAGGKKDNWKHTVSSNPDCVYLTVAYPLHFMFNALRINERFGVIIEIETDLLPSTTYLLPDEDCLAQAYQLQNPDCNEHLYDITKRFREQLLNFADGERWKASIEVMGTCCYFGTVPVKAITRTVKIDTKRNPHLALKFDPTISIHNYSLLGPLYRAATLAMFGDQPEGKLLEQATELYDKLGYDWDPKLVNAVVSKSIFS